MLPLSVRVRRDRDEPDARRDEIGAYNVSKRQTRGESRDSLTARFANIMSDDRTDPSAGFAEHPRRSAKWRVLTKMDNKRINWRSADTANIKDTISIRC